MNNDELAAIRARCEAATPGPWDAHANLGYCGIMAGGDKKPLLRADGCTFGDGLFVAAARTDVPALLDEIERLRDEVADALDLRAGHGPTALEMAMAEVEQLRAALTIYGERQNWHYERLPSEYVHPNEVNLYSWVGDGFRAPWQLANKVLEKDGDA